MPIDAAIFSDLGINAFALPDDVGRLDPDNGRPADWARIDALKNDIEQVNNTSLRYYTNPSGQECFIPHSAAYTSYIDIGPAGAQTRYYVRAHIANGSVGSICKVSTSPDPAAGEIIRILKLQKISCRYPVGHPAYTIQTGYNWNNFIQMVKEAVINKFLATINPTYYNIIYKIGIAPLIAGYPLRIYYLLEQLEETFETRIERLGAPGPMGSPVDTEIGTITGNTLCTVKDIIDSLHTVYSGSHGDLKINNLMFYTDVAGEKKPKLIDFGYSRLEYEGALLECNIYFNKIPSASRDLTMLIFSIWHNALGWRCSINADLEYFLTWPNPDGAVFSTFESWSERHAIRDEPNFTMTVKAGTNAARIATARVAAKLRTGIPDGDRDYISTASEDAVTLYSVPPVGLAELYLYFNVFDNPNATPAAVAARLLCPAPLGAPAPGEGGSRRKRDRVIKRNVRYTRKNAKKHKRHGKGRRTQRASSSLY